jgi:hypothetical protein
MYIALSVSHSTAARGRSGHSALENYQATTEQSVGVRLQAFSWPYTSYVTYKIAANYKLIVVGTPAGQKCMRPMADWSTLGNAVYGTAALFKRGVNLGRAILNGLTSQTHLRHSEAC